MKHLSHNIDKVTSNRDACSFVATPSPVLGMGHAFLFNMSFFSYFLHDVLLQD